MEYKEQMRDREMNSERSKWGIKLVSKGGLTFSLKYYKELFKDFRQGSDIMCVCLEMSW